MFLILKFNLLIILANCLLQPPPDGKFFYCGIQEDQGNMYVNLEVGTPRQNFSIWMSTNEYSTGLFSKSCGDSVCTVP